MRQQVDPLEHVFEELKSRQLIKTDPNSELEERMMKVFSATRSSRKLRPTLTAILAVLALLMASGAGVAATVGFDHVIKLFVSDDGMLQDENGNVIGHMEGPVPENMSLISDEETTFIVVE